MTKRRLSSNVAFPCAAVPLTHSAGLVAHAPRAVAARAVHLLLYPFVGGRLHAIFHTLAWVSFRGVERCLKRAAVMLLTSLCAQMEEIASPVLLQVTWGLSLMIAAPVLLSARLIPDSHVEALLGAAAVGAVFAELFMIKVRTQASAQGDTTPYTPTSVASSNHVSSSALALVQLMGRFETVCFHS